MVVALLKFDGTALRARIYIIHKLSVLCDNINVPSDCCNRDGIAPAALPHTAAVGPVTIIHITRR